MNLKEFLETSSSDDKTALAAAQKYTEFVLKDISQRMVNERTVFGLIGNASGERFMTALESMSPEIIPNRVKTWFKPSEDGIDINSTSAIAIIDSMAISEIIVKDEANILKNYAYDLISPFANTTLHNVKTTRNSFEYIVAPDGQLKDGRLIIKLTANCENHNPRVLTKDPHTGKWQSVNNFIDVSIAGLYSCAVPVQFRNWGIKVEDVYGLIGIV